MAEEEPKQKKIFEEKYDVPEVKEALVDVHKGEVVKPEDVKPFDIIKALAKKYKWEISDPSKGCNKCYGRGYIGIDFATKAPVPCQCLFRKRSVQQRTHDNAVAQASTRLNHDKRRKMKKFMHKKLAAIKMADPKLIDNTKEEIATKLENFAQSADEFFAQQDALNASSAADEATGDIQDNTIRVSANPELDAQRDAQAEQALASELAENEANHQNDKEPIITATGIEE
jgi:hypothetical protein